MNASTFDALTAARELKAAGVESAQAEAIAEQLRAAAAADHHALATKADLTVLRTELSALRADIYRALWIQGVGIIAVLTALRLLPF